MQGFFTAEGAKDVFKTKLFDSLDIPVIFLKTIKKIVEDFEKLTLFMRDGLVSGTTNPVENYYRNTIPDPLKRIFKTNYGDLNFLNVRKEYWIEHIAKNI